MDKRKTTGQSPGTGLVRSVRAVLRSFVAALVVVATIASPSQAQPTEGATVLIIGADREIGSVLTRGYAERGWSVIGTVPDPTTAGNARTLAQQFSNITIEVLDVTDFATIDTLSKTYRNQPIDILIYATRLPVGEAPGGMDAQKLGQFNYDTFHEALIVNAGAALKVIEAFNDQVEASSFKKIIKISSATGSIGTPRDCIRCGNFFGRASHAAGNMLMRRLYQYHKGNETCVVIGILDPGPVSIAAMDSLVADNFPAALIIPVEESVAGMMQVIDGLDETTNGSFFNYKGEHVPW